MIMDKTKAAELCELRTGVRHIPGYKSFLSMLNTVIGVDPKLLLPQAFIFILNSWDYNSTWGSVQGSKIEF